MINRWVLINGNKYAAIKALKNKHIQLKAIITAKIKTVWLFIVGIFY